MIEGPEWNVYGVIAYDEFGQRTVLGGSRNQLASLAMWKVFVESRPLSDVVLCHGARVIRRSKPEWELCKGSPK